MTASVTTPVYRALFCDLRTDRLLDVLPLTETKFDDYIGKPGSLSATVPLPEGSLAARARATRTRTSRVRARRRRISSLVRRAGLRSALPRM
ncbi:hypothetical protein AB0L31_41215, partial [Streptomyces sp. NPDC052535]